MVSRDAKVRADPGDVAVLADPVALAKSPDVDLIVIASPDASHAPLTTAALGAGKQVIAGKPFTVDLAEARALAALAHDRRLPLSVFTTSAGTATS